MSVTSGFFNSLNGDRKYNAEQMSSIFDGVINDGVFANIGTAFQIQADEGNTVTVGIGKAWFDSSWLLNDSILPIALEEAEVLQHRYDAIVIEIDHSEAVRAGSIKVVKGTPSTKPAKPSLTRSEYVNQYPLAYIYRKAESTAITQADIENRIGMEDCPYITGILQVQNIEKNVAQWQAQWEEWYAENTANASSQVSQMLSDLQIMLSDTAADIASWKSQQEADFDTWFNSIKGMLADDPATSLAAAISDLETEMNGKLDGKLDDVGDTVSGSLMFKRAENGYAAINKNHSIDNDYGLQFVDVDANDTEVQLVVSAKDGGLYFVKDGVRYPVYTECNRQPNDYQYSQTDLTAGSSELESGKLYFVYE